MVRSVTLTAAVVLTLCAENALATTVLYQDVAALSRQADAIVRGTVTKQSSHWTGDRRRIVTDVEVSVADTYKGGDRKTVLLRQPGGVVGDIGQRVDGFPTFRDGEEVVLFLERRPDDSFVVSGAAQGKYRVERSADGRGVFAIPDANVGEAQVIDPLTRVPTPVSPKTWALEDLRIEIAKAVATVPPEPTTPPKTPGKATGGK